MGWEWEWMYALTSFQRCVLQEREPLHLLLDRQVIRPALLARLWFMCVLVRARDESRRFDRSVHRSVATAVGVYVCMCGEAHNPTQHPPFSRAPRAWRAWRSPRCPSSSWPPCQPAKRACFDFDCKYRKKSPCKSKRAQTQQRRVVCAFLVCVNTSTYLR